MTSSIDPFEDLRPFADHHVAPVLRDLLADTDLVGHFCAYFPCFTPASLRAACAEITDIAGFQRRIMVPVVDHLLAVGTTSVTTEGLERLTPGRRRLFVSNHRDIALDSTLLARALFAHTGETLQPAIGDNLLSSPLAARLFRLNKTVIVQRGLAPRALLAASRRLSSYIHHVVSAGEDSFWIAQAEGRCKDGHDRTQPGLLKMLTLAAGKDWLPAMRRLDPVPVSVSYEFDPCDAAKARELLERARTGTYVKRPGEDLESILTGLTGFKGRVHLHLGRLTEEDWAAVADAGSPGRRLAAFCRAFDRHIIGGYKAWPCNYLADDLLHGTDSHADRYTSEDRTRFAARLAPYAAEPDLTRKLLAMYAAPVMDRRNLAADGGLAP